MVAEAVFALVCQLVVHVVAGVIGEFDCEGVGRIGGRVKIGAISVLVTATVCRIKCAVVAAAICW